MPQRYFCRLVASSQVSGPPESPAHTSLSPVPAHIMPSVTVKPLRIARHLRVFNIASFAFCKTSDVHPFPVEPQPLTWAQSEGSNNYSPVRHWLGLAVATILPGKIWSGVGILITLVKLSNFMALWRTRMAMSFACVRALYFSWTIMELTLGCCSVPSVIDRSYSPVTRSIVAGVMLRTQCAAVRRNNGWIMEALHMISFPFFFWLK